MKMFVISDDADTCVGMRLSGVFAMLVHDKEQALDALEKASSDPEAGIILITEKVKEFCPEMLKKINACGKPIIMEIPDSRNSEKTIDSASDYLKNTVGISV